MCSFYKWIRSNSNLNFAKKQPIHSVAHKITVSKRKEKLKKEYVLKSGMLGKQMSNSLSNSTKLYKERWCVLRPQKLNYYKSAVVIIISLFLPFYKLLNFFILQIVGPKSSWKNKCKKYEICRNFRSICNIVIFKR